MKLLDHGLFLCGLIFMFFPVFLMRSHHAVLNHLVDLPIMVLVNVLLLLFFLEREVRRYRYQSIFLLIIAAISVFSSFLRIIPLPAGISLAFHLPISAGVVFGPSFGFLIGQLSMLIGGIFLGAFGPWLPYQAFLMGGFGYYAGYFFQNTRSIPLRFMGVIGYSFIMSFAFGYCMSVDTWRLATMDTELPHDWIGRMKSYGQYYALTSLFWDLTRAVGNLIVLGIFLKPTIELFDRAKTRLTYYK